MPSSEDESIVGWPTAVNPVWHALAVWQTLHPVPVHPLAHWQLDAVRLAKDPVELEVNCRFDP